MFLFAPGWVPGLVLYLAALWWGGRIVHSYRLRAAALAASPLVALFLFVGGIQILAIQLVALAGSIVYGCVVRLPAATR